MLLRDRSDDLMRAGITVVGVSLDSHWSHRAWAEALALGESVTLLSDRLAEATRAFDVLGDTAGMPKAERSAFLVRDGVIEGAWFLGPEMPDIDEVIAVTGA